MVDTADRIGKVHDEDYGRDAIHVPVLTMKAPREIFIGRYEKVFVDREGNQLSEHHPSVVGIVDPWLPSMTTIPAGTWFYVFVKPGRITKLNHVWDHPEIPLPPPEVMERIVYRDRDDDDDGCGAC